MSWLKDHSFVSSSLAVSSYHPAAADAGGGGRVPGWLEEKYEKAELLPLAASFELA